MQDTMVTPVPLSQAPHGNGVAPAATTYAARPAPPMLPQTTVAVNELYAEARTHLEADDRAAAVRCMHRMAGIYLTAGHLQDGEETLVLTRDAYRDLGAEDAAAMCTADLGNLLRRLRRHTEAEGMLSATIAAVPADHSGAEFSPGILRCLRVLAYVHADMGDFTRAIERLRAAEAGYSRLGSLRDAADCSAGLARIYAALGFVNSAQVALNHAIADYHRLGAEDRLKDCEVVAELFAQAAQKSGEARKMPWPHSLQNAS